MGNFQVKNMGRIGMKLTSDLKERKSKILFNFPSNTKLTTGDYFVFFQNGQQVGEKDVDKSQPYCFLSVGKSPYDHDVSLTDNGPYIISKTEITWTSSLDNLRLEEKDRPHGVYLTLDTLGHSSTTGLRKIECHTKGHAPTKNDLQNVFQDSLKEANLIYKKQAPARLPDADKYINDKKEKTHKI